MPGFVEPMKAKLVDSMPTGNWLFEIKFDDYRALALRGGGETRVLSRNQKDLDEKGRSSFQLLQGFDMGQMRPPIVFYAFDLLQLNGKNLQGLPIEERKAKLEELLKKPPGVLRYSASFTNDIPELLDRARSLGWKG
jgi:bifunctional non-homologous end joining protein LigD